MKCTVTSHPLRWDPVYSIIVKLKLGSIKVGKNVHLLGENFIITDLQFCNGETISVSLQRALIRQQCTYLMDLKVKSVDCLASLATLSKISSAVIKIIIIFGILGYKDTASQNQSLFYNKARISSEVTGPLIDQKPIKKGFDD